MTSVRKMELLAPAGNAETALAAFDAGADAVYCGLGCFNARARAENFTFEEMARLIGFARDNGKKVYLTLNTLVYESELPRLADTLGEIARLGPDALIVQDLGVAAIVREYFPDLTLHASTQMNIHNSAGVEFAAKCGFRRVILERQVSLEELRQIAAKSRIELEVFIHGSLCCSLSGRCLLSHSLFGAGGNRGVCKQPCRRRYDGEYRLSPSDLVGIEVLDELRKINIASLKIEGRLRPPEYVWKCTRAYRMLLDAPASDEKTRMDAAKLLSSASGRAPDCGFFDPARYAKIIDPSRPGVFGIPTGTVTYAGKGRFTVRLENKLHLGDRLRLVDPQGGEGETFSLVSMRGGSGKLLRAKAGSSVEIASDCRAAAGMKVLKIGENGFDFSRRLKNLPPAGERIDLNVAVSASEITVASPRLAGVWKKTVDFPVAQRHALEADTVRASFSSGAPDFFRAGKIGVRIEGNLFVPGSVLKTLRREFWCFAAKNRLPAEDKAASFRLDLKQNGRSRTPEMLPDFPDAVSGAAAFVPETHLAEAEKTFLKTAAKEKNFFVDGLYALLWLEKIPRRTVVGCRFPVAVTNSFAAKLLRSFGVAAVEAAPELPGRERERLEKNAPIPLLPAGRRVPLLVTRLKLTPGVWRDDTGHVFSVKNEGEGTSALYGEKI